MVLEEEIIVFYAYKWVDGEWVLYGASFDLKHLEAECERRGFCYATIGGW